MEVTKGLGIIWQVDLPDECDPSNLRQQRASTSWLPVEGELDAVGRGALSTTPPRDTKSPHSSFELSAPSSGGC